MDRINGLSPEVQLELASIWVEARDEGEWERFMNHCALSPSESGYVALLQAEMPTVESDGARVLLATK